MTFLIWQIFLRIIAILSSKKRKIARPLQLQSSDTHTLNGEHANAQLWIAVTE